MSIASYKDLAVWQDSVELALSVYQATESYPSHETFGLASQMRRASVSIPANIAEGQRRGTKEFVHSLRIAYGSGSELETHITIAARLGYLTNEREKILMDNLALTQKRLNRLIATLTIKLREN